MQELGDLLRKAREAKGVTLGDAEDATRIRARYLEALEYGDENALPGRVYVEGFVRNYAAYLGLSPREVMARYRAAHETPEPEMPSLRGSIHPAPMPGPGRWLRVLMALALVGILVAGGVYLGNLLPPLSLDLSGFGLPGIIPLPTTPPQLAPGPEEATPAPTSELTSEPTPEPTLAPTPAQPEIPTPAPTAAPTATRVPEVRVQVLLTDRAWLRVTLDGAVAFEGLLEAGESRTWVARDEVYMRSGNAGGTVVTVDGVLHGPLGAPGQVEERTFFRQ
jgi:cytoskeletal protein RodZ